MQIFIITLGIFTWLNYDPFSITGNEFFGIHKKPVVEWTFNPALILPNRTSAGIVFIQKSSGGKPIYSLHMINRIDYFNWYKLGEGGGVYYISSGNRIGFAVRLLTRKYGLNHYYYYYNSHFSNPVLNGNSTDYSDFANIALSWKMTENTSLGLGMDLIRSGITDKNSIFRTSIDSTDLGDRYLFNYDFVLRENVDSNNYGIGGIKIGFSSNDVALHAGVFKLERKYIEARIYNHDYKYVMGSRDTTGHQVSVTSGSQYYKTSLGLDGSMMGFEGGLVFKYKIFKGSICLDRLKDNIPFELSSDSTVMAYNGTYDTTNYDTSYRKIFNFIEKYGKPVNNTEYEFQFTRLNVNLGNEFSLKEGLKGIMSISSEYINSKVEGNVTIVSTVIDGYTSIDSSDTGYIRRDSTDVDTEYIHFAENLNSEVTYIEPKLNIGLMMKVNRNLSIIGIVNAGFVYLNTSNTWVEESVTNSFISLRLGFSFNFKKWEISGRNDGNIFDLGGWTLMLSRKL